MRTKKMCLMALAAITMGTSCTRVDLDELGSSVGGGGSNPAVQFFDGQINDLSLRLTNYPKNDAGPNAGGYNTLGTDSAVFERGDLIGIYMVDTISNINFINVLRANVPYKKMYGDTFMLATGTDSIRLPTSGRVKFFAYYPWDANTAWPDIFWSVADQSDPSKLDLLVASDNNKGTGFGKITMESNIGDSIVRPPAKVVLRFRHMLSKITLKIVAGDGANIDQNSVAQVTMGVIQGSNMTTTRIQYGDTVPLTGTFHMTMQPGDSATGGAISGGVNPLGKGYMDYPLPANTKRGAISFYPATNRSRYTALVIPHNYGGKHVAIRLTEKGQLPEDFAGTLPGDYEDPVGTPKNVPGIAAQLSAGNKHYIVTATLQRGAVKFDDVTIEDWEVIQGGDIFAW